MDTDTRKPTGKRLVTFECRDIGYGVEWGQVIGYWDETDHNLGGGPRFDVVDRVTGTGPNSHLYLFDDEVLDDEAWTTP